jgi:transcription-repair coupling factor (superfamily II helicase)
VIDAGGRIGRELRPERQNESLSLFGALTAHVDAKRKAGQVVIASYSDGARERLQGLMEDEGLADPKPIRDWRDIPDGKGGVFLAVWGWTRVRGARSHRHLRTGRPRRPADPRPPQEAPGRELPDRGAIPLPGDLVVHVDHGVGRYTGLEVVTALGAAHECILLEYAGGDRLYLPVENIELLSRFGHEEGLLDRWAAGPGRRRRRSSRSASARSPTASSASPPNASCAPRR